MSKSITKESADGLNLNNLQQFKVILLFRIILLVQCLLGLLLHCQHLQAETCESLPCRLPVHQPICLTVNANMLACMSRWPTCLGTLLVIKKPHTFKGKGKSLFTCHCAYNLNTTCQLTVFILNCFRNLISQYWLAVRKWKLRKITIIQKLYFRQHMSLVSATSCFCFLSLFVNSGQNRKAKPYWDIGPFRKWLWIIYMFVLTYFCSTYHG